MRKSKLIVMWSTDPIMASGGSPAYHYLQAKKAGAKFIFIDPYYSNSARVLADEWIPIRPGTDTPMLPAAQARTGDFELRFWVADYFKTPDTFADIVPVRFTIADAAQHYHVPLLLSPFGYSTYRGS